VFTFQFLNDKIYSYTKKGHLAIGNLEKLVFWSILSKMIPIAQASILTGTFLPLLTSKQL
jgi:hypothetical protein